MFCYFWLYDFYEHSIFIFLKVFLIQFLIFISYFPIFFLACVVKALELEFFSVTRSNFSRFSLFLLLYILGSILVMIHTYIFSFRYVFFHLLGERFKFSCFYMIFSSSSVSSRTAIFLGTRCYFYFLMNIAMKSFSAQWLYCFFNSF